MSETTNAEASCPFAGGSASILSRSLAEPDILTAPNDYYHALRLGDPIRYDEKLGMYLVSRYDDLQTVLRDPVTFSQEKGWNQNFARGHFEEFKSILIRDGGGYFPEAILRDPPRHARVRRLMEKAFSAHRIALLEPRITAVISNLIEKVADLGSADGLTDLAMPMTIAIMSEQLGIDHADGAKVAQWSRSYTAQIGGGQDHATMLADAKQICELQHYIIARVRERQEKRTEDMISDLIYARLDDEENPTLTFEETVALARAMLVGGNDTTATALTNMLFMLATRPDVRAELEACVDDKTRLARFVEELLRIEPPVRSLFRVTTKDVALAGKALPQGAYICMLFASANDDEDVFNCPRTFDMERKNVGRHMSFGAGIHLCVGIALARMELRVAAREFATRLKDIRLAIPATEIKYVPSISLLSMESLPLTFSRRQ